MEIEKEDRPLWMPKGSVRALIALAAIGSMCYMGISNATFEMPEFMMTTVGIIIGFYFGNRAK